MIIRTLALLGALLVSASAFAQSVGVTPAQPPQPNLLINQFMKWDQRLEGTNAAASNGNYTIDGWKQNFVLTTATLTGFQQSAADAPTGYLYSEVATVNSGAAMASGDHVGLVQNIEGFRFAETGIGTANAVLASATIWLKSSVSGAVVAIALQNQARNRSYVHNCTTTGTGWSLCQFTFPLDATGTWLTGKAQIGMRLEVNFGCGATGQITADTWTGSTGYCTSASTNIAATSSATLKIGPVKFEISPFPTPFIPLDMAAEYVQVARYYQKTFPDGTKPAQSAGVAGSFCENGTNAGTTGVHWFFAPKLVQVPATVTTFNPSAANANWRDVANTADVTATTDPQSAKGAEGVFIQAAAAAAVSRTICIHAIAESGF